MERAHSLNWDQPRNSAVKFADQNDEELDDDSDPLISTTSGPPMNFVRHDTPHPRELRARHQKLFANRSDQIKYDKEGYELGLIEGPIESNVDQNGEDLMNVNSSDTSSVSSVIIKNDEDIQDENQTYCQNHAFEDHVDSAINDNHKVLNDQMRKVNLSDSVESDEMTANQSEKVRHVGFENMEKQIEDEEGQEEEEDFNLNEKLNTRLHRRDTPHHLKNKRIASSKDEKEKFYNILQSHQNNLTNQSYGLNNIMKESTASYTENHKTSIIPVMILQIVMKRTGPGLGLSIAGGLGSSPYKGDDEGIFVSRITEGGPAEAAGLKVGDKVLSVNDCDFHRIDHHLAVEKLKSVGTEFTLTIEREAPQLAINNNKVPPLPPVRTSVISRSSVSSQEEPVLKNHKTNPPVPASPSRLILNRLSSGDLNLPKQIIHTTLIRDENGLGFSIAGGKGAAPYKEDSDGIYVSTIFEGGAADKDGKLMIGDKILSINGVNLEKLDHDQVIGKLTGLERFVRLVIERENTVENGNTGQLLYSANSYMANRPSYTGSYRRPLLGSVNSLTGAGADNALGSAGTISTPATPSFTHTSKPMSSIFNAKLPGLRSDPMSSSYITTTMVSSSAPTRTITTSSSSSTNQKYSSSAFNSNSTTLVNSCSSPQLSSKSASHESGN